MAISSPRKALPALVDRFRLRSLRARLTLAAALTVVGVLAAVWVLLGLMFEDHIERLLEDDLQSRLLELAGSLAIDDDGRPALVSEPSDPRYQRPAGGAYWRVEEDGKTVLRSPSLWDFDFTPSQRLHLSPTGVALEVRGPKGSTVYLANREIVLEGAASAHRLRIAVALDTLAVERLRRSFAGQVVVALGVIAVVLSVGAWIQSSFGLRPLKEARERLDRVQRGDEARMTGRFPAEITPLVDDLNKLLARQEDLVRRARERAGDLAHGLKTPLTIIGIEANNAAKRGDVRAAASLRDQVEAMNRHVERELRRARMSGASAGGGAYVEARGTIDRIVRIMRPMPGADAIDWRNELPAAARLRMDPDDFGEIAGNLLDNARKHTRAAVRICLDVEAGTKAICFDDDGPGISPEDRERIIRRGERASAESEGSGLGLSIVLEALAQYGLALAIGESPLGGCRMSFPAVGWTEAPRPG
jgi:signal transduction histidine kinase